MLQLLKAYSTETDCKVWIKIYDILTRLDTLLQMSNTRMSEMFSVFCASLMKKIHERLGYVKREDECKHIIMQFLVVVN